MCYNYKKVQNGDRMINKEKLLDTEKHLEEMGSEVNPLLSFDAFTGGVKNGGLRSVSSIYLLVCYLVANLDKRVTADVITQALAEGEIANHFEVSDAISKLIANNTLVEDADGALSLSDNTTADIALIEQDLPYTVRESAMHISQKIIARETHKRENKVEIIEDNNAYKVILHIGDNKTDFMTLSLYAPTRDQAEMIKDKFIADPAKVYGTLIESLFENET